MEEAFHLKEWTREREYKAKKIHISKTILDQNIHHSSCNFIQQEFQQLWEKFNQLVKTQVLLHLDRNQATRMTVQLKIITRSIDSVNMVKIKENQLEDLKHQIHHWELELIKHQQLLKSQLKVLITIMENLLVSMFKESKQETVVDQ